MSIFVIAMSIVIAQEVNAQVFQDEQEKAVYSWLCQAQRANGFISTESHNFDSVYSMAVASMAYMLYGDVNRAERVLDFYAGIMPREFTGPEPSKRGFVQFHLEDGSFSGSDNIRWLGDCSWLLLAINQYRDLTGSHRYDKMAWAVVEWIDDLQDREGNEYCESNDGALWYGFNSQTNELVRTKCNEGMIDAYAALRPYHGTEKLRASIKKYLMTQYDPVGKRLPMNDATAESDSETQAWACMAFLDGKLFPMDYVEKTFKVTVTSEVTGLKLSGFAFMFGDVREGRLEIAPTIEIACAYYTLGRKDRGDFYIREIEKALLDSKEHPGTKGLAFVANKTRWPNDSADLRKPAPHSCAWYLFARKKFNPFQVGRRPALPQKD